MPPPTFIMFTVFLALLTCHVWVWKIFILHIDTSIEELSNIHQPDQFVKFISKRWSLLNTFFVFVFVHLKSRLAITAYISLPFPSFLRQLYEMTNQLANMLRTHGIKKGDRVVLYLPVMPIAVAAMMACARIGALHSVVFAGFSAEALASRIRDGQYLMEKKQLLNFSLSTQVNIEGMVSD